MSLVVGVRLMQELKTAANVNTQAFKPSIVKVGRSAECCTSSLSTYVLVKEYDCNGRQ